MARGNIGRTIRLFADRVADPASRSATLIAAARAARDDLVRSGQASPTWRTVVDGTPAATEDGARRVIVYRFSRLPQAAAAALEEAQRRSPVRSGTFRRSWFVAVDGRRYTGDLAAIPAGVEVMVSNDQPYSRKIEVGAMRMSVPPGICEAVRQLMQRRFPGMVCEVAYVTWPSAYTLKRGNRRKDRTKGRALTYPAVVMREREV